MHSGKADIPLPLGTNSCLAGNTLILLLVFLLTPFSDPLDSFMLSVPEAFSAQPCQIYYSVKYIKGRGNVEVGSGAAEFLGVCCN